ncbi:MAG: hypothetical protein DRJ03_21995 [Chloroflexi bacterium]|nr:MAG: hypothetical protein B6I35_01735 [Anaerolineaceae bacterium 4572_32.2]RLC80298.1 MAG: hypothetical protein DRJ03_21995 [Chloroflexota bacterium]RLC81304.1 MAG: hypothetical protein DRI81_02700 [Chloroflexota bacterium]HEY74428.1 hypothetical protein [Thermoflexia bacterium]
MYYPFETQVTPLTTIRRQRILPAPGEVLVRADQRVEPTHTVAQAELPGDFRILPLARLLGVSLSQVKRCLRVSIKDTVQKGQIVAKRIGHSIESPITGVVTATGSGRMLIEAQPALFELHAYIPGIVSNVLKDYGVIIETVGALVQGIWGAGSESFGVLKRLVESPDEPLQDRAIDPSCHGAILIGGSSLDDATLKAAQELQVRGIVTGGLPPKLIPQAEQLPFPIVVTEGIGSVPMSTPIFRLLTTNDGREASISGKLQPRWDVVRPEVIIPLPDDTSVPAQVQPGSPLTVGARVRAVRAPYMGRAGTIKALPTNARLIDTGARVHGAEVDIGQDEPVFIPLANLEILR